ncbi:MAG: hypothetical protein A3F13_05305 [Gammaproteobacteria bacterium RIFCSPHIGHO2_12_FULL_40_19]|nr:MAG: hypothetical protein A3F13_05305 [Gammaproteobacteria bacterium RIFCSPHIGHO2_12_FULL_40_19]
MRRWICLISLLISLCPLYSLAAAKAVILPINGPIGPATQDYIERGLKEAAEEKAAIVILEINTPGGLETSMRGINNAIIASPVPVVSYVAPSGARAASAGTFILYASHLAAMAPGTNLGAASPVQLTGPTETDDKKAMDTHTKKAMNDAAAYIRSLAEMRNRNGAWGEKAVREAASLSAEEARKQKVIEIVANDYQALLKEINRHIITIDGKTKTINTSQMTLDKKEPGLRYQFLSFITNPNIVYILMLIALYGLFFELSNPGLILPGVAGVIALLLVLYAFQLMPINYVGLFLILIGITFMILEVFITSFGMLGIGGLIAFIIGSVMLFDIQHPAFRIDRSLIMIMTAVTMTFFFIIMGLVIKSQKRAMITGKDSLIGSTGTVISVMNEQVVVKISGEIWEARSRTMLPIGQKVKVVSIEGLILHVEPVEGL